MTKIKWLSSLALAGMLSVAGVNASQAEQIVVANYGSSVNGMPWVVALEKGFFKEQGLDITGIIGSQGGSSEVRNLIAGDLAYADSALVPILTAIKAGGSDLKIVSENGHTTTQFVWIVMPNSPIKTMADLKGKSISFTTPLSTSQILNNMLVKKAGLAQGDVKLVSTGAYGAALTALQNNGIDVALVAEPVYTLNKDKFRPLFFSRDIFPAISSTVGVTSAKVAKDRPDAIRGIILAHRKAVEYMKANPKESAQLIAKVYKMDPGIVEQVITELMDHNTSDGQPFYSLGDLYPKGMDAIVDASLEAGALKDKVDWRQYVDQSFLPDDLKRDIK
jgi:NitT/TauT family transport system substrate-binding protein